MHFPASAPKKSKITSMTQIALFVAFMPICAWITIPGVIPFTLQIFAVFLALDLLGGKKGTLAILLYLFLGGIGLPVFHGFRGGFSVFFEATGGYLLGFIILGLTHTALTAFLPEKKVFRYLASILGLMTCYLFGSFWFYRLYLSAGTPLSYSSVLQISVIPFLIPDLCKLFLAVSLSNHIRKLAPGLFMQ